MKMDTSHPHQSPNDYSSTIIFQEKADRINVSEFKAPGCVRELLTHERDSCLIPELTYTVGHGKVFFVGFKENSTSSMDVKVYDLHSFRWESFPSLNAPKPAPYVFFLDEKLYVLSSGMEEGTHFEMLDCNNISREWSVLPESSFAWERKAAFFHGKIIDHSEEMLYIRLLDDFSFDLSFDFMGAKLYGYSVRENKWHTYNNLSTLSPRQANLLKSNWSNESIIVANYLYGFRMYDFSDEIRAMIIIRNLDHSIEVYNNAVEDDYVDTIHSDNDPPVEGVSEVDISTFVKDVVEDLDAIGSLVHLGDRGSDHLFSLVISFRSFDGNNHFYACEFLLNPNEKSVSNFSGFLWHSDDMVQFACHKLCEIRSECP